MSNIEGLKEKARRHEQKEEWRKALELYNRAIDRLAEEDTPDIGLYNRVGDLFIRVGETDQAVTAFEKAVELYVESELPNNAIAVCKKILRNVADRAEVFLRMGRIRADQGFLVDARTHFLTYAERRQAAGDLDEAMRALVEFADAAPDDTEIRLAIATHFQQHDRMDEAVEQLLEGYRSADRQGLDDEMATFEERLAELRPGADPAILAAAASGGDDGAADGAEPDDAEFAIESTSLATGSDDEYSAADSAVAEAMEDQAGDAAADRDDEAAAGGWDYGDTQLLSDNASGEDSSLETGGDASGFETPYEADEPPASPSDAAPPVLDGSPSAFDTGADQEDSPGIESQSRLHEHEPFDVFAEPEDVAGEVADDAAFGAAMDRLGEADVGDAGETYGHSFSDAGASDALSTGSAAPSGDSDALDEARSESGPDVGHFDGVPDAANPLEGFEVVADDDEGAIDLPLTVYHDDDGDDDDDEAVELPFLHQPEGEAVVHVVDEPVAEMAGATIAEEVDDSAGSAAVADEADDAGDDLEQGVDADQLAARIADAPDDLDLRQRAVEFAHRSGDEAALAAAYVGLGEALRRSGDEGRAQAVFRQALQLDPDHREARAALDGAQEATRPVAEVASNEDYVDLGAMILGDEDEKTTRFVVAYEEPSGDEQADFARMLTQFKAKVAENVDSDDVKAHHDLGTAYKEMGLLDEAVEEFQAALRASADHLPTYEMLGQTFLDRGTPRAAVRVLTRALDVPFEVEDELLGIYYSLGRSHEDLGNTEQAREFYERIFSLDINFADVTERLRALR